MHAATDEEDGDADQDVEDPIPVPDFNAIFKTNKFAAFMEQSDGEDETPVLVSGPKRNRVEKEQVPVPVNRQKPDVVVVEEDETPVLNRRLKGKQNVSVPPAAHGKVRRKGKKGKGQADDDDL